GPGGWGAGNPGLPPPYMPPSHCVPAPGPRRSPPPPYHTYPPWVRTGAQGTPTPPEPPTHGWKRAWKELWDLDPLRRDPDCEEACLSLWGDAFAISAMCVAANVGANIPLLGWASLLSKGFAFWCDTNGVTRVAQFFVVVGIGEQASLRVNKWCTNFYT